MLPLEGILFIPSLIVAPLALIGIYFWRRKASYARLWSVAIGICVLLTLLFTVQVLSKPLYSQRSHSPANPGGFSASPSLILAVFLLETCVVMPAFPVLVGLALMPPSGKRRASIVCLLYVALMAGLIGQKHVRYVADYQQAKPGRGRVP